MRLTFPVLLALAACQPRPPDVALPRPGFWEVEEFAYRDLTCDGQTVPPFTANSTLKQAFVGHVGKDARDLMLSWGGPWRGYAIVCEYFEDRSFVCPQVVGEPRATPRYNAAFVFDLSGSWEVEELELSEFTQTTCNGEGCTAVHCEYTEDATLTWVAEDVP